VGGGIATFGWAAIAQHQPAAINMQKSDTHNYQRTRVSEESAPNGVIGLRSLSLRPTLGGE